VKVTNKYIALTDERVSDLLKLVDTAVDNTIVNNRLNQETFGTLVAYLNLLVALKQGLKQNPEFEKLVKKTTRLVDSAEKEIKGEQQSRGLTEKNAVGILRVSLDRLDV
jgi:DNA-binding MurR/RpiR family transcriptional regulator